MEEGDRVAAAQPDPCPSDSSKLHTPMARSYNYLFAKVGMNIATLSSVPDSCNYANGDSVCPQAASGLSGSSLFRWINRGTDCSGNMNGLATKLPRRWDRLPRGLHIVYYQATVLLGKA